MNTAKNPASETSPIIASIESVGKIYGDKMALKNVTFDIKAGEVLAVLGPNGAGKTTIINILLGRLSTSTGKINVLGHKPGAIELKRLCGALLQVSSLPDTLKVKEHIELFQSYYPSPMAYEQVIDYADLADIQYEFSKNLSGGQKQRLLFALAICGDPHLLFLDEPSVGMDITSRKSLWRAIRALKKKGASIVLTTHYLEEADALSDRIIMINQGEVVRVGTPAEIKAQVSSKKVTFKSSALLKLVASLKCVEKVEFQDGCFELQTSDPDATLKDLFSNTDDVTDLKVTGAALEDAFLALTQNQG